MSARWMMVSGIYLGEAGVIILLDSTEYGCYTRIKTIR